MENQGNSGRIVFAELDIEGRRIECPSCRVPISPHLGNLILPRFQCENCRANLSYRNGPGRTVRCPCCHFARPVPHHLVTLVCRECEATIIYQKGARAVKCSLCKRITTPPVTNHGVGPVNRVVPPQVNRVVPPQVNRVVPPQVNQVVHPQVNRIVVPQDNRIVHPEDNRVAPQVNLVAPPQVNRVVPPQVNRNRRNRTATVETVSTASSCFSPKPAEITKSIETAEMVAEIVRNAALRFQRESEEEDKSEESKSKKSRH